MDAVELPYPVDVAAPKLMGTEGFVRAGVTVREVEARESDGVSVLVSPPIERCKTLLSQKDVRTVVMASESGACNKIPDAELCKHADQLPSFRREDVSAHCCDVETNCLLKCPQPEGVQLQRRAVKVSRSGSVCSKKPRLAQMEDSLSIAGGDDKKYMTDKLELNPTRCTSPENTQMTKQKNSFNKRGDKRGFRVPGKIKYDSFSMKAGSSNFGSAAGGNNIFGVYGLKLDNHDITKHVGDPPLNDLLNGSYTCSSLVKDKGKKAENLNEGFLHSVRKAFSVLQLSRPSESQSFADIENFSEKKISTCLSNSISCDKGEYCSTDLSSCKKDSCSKPDTGANPLDLPLHQPKDILKRLVLTEPKDLESLLLDAAKSSSSSRNTSDLRPSKQMSRRVSLPPFQWSHTYTGHCRTNSDAIKLPATRSTCQGRWVRIGNISSSLMIAADCLANLESLTYDQSLVPSGLRAEKKTFPSVPVSFPRFEWDSSKASHIFLGSRGKVTYQGNAEQCPRVLAAAQTLCDIATHTFKQNQDGIIRWPKKPSQKVMKARKLKSNEKHEETFAASIPLLASSSLVRSADHLVSSKKPKLSITESSKDVDHPNGLRRGPINWSTPRSSRSSPSKSIKDSIAETRHPTAGIFKQPCAMPPPARVGLDKACNNGQQKVRKLLPMGWNRGRDGHD